MFEKIKERVHEAIELGHNNTRSIMQHTGLSYNQVYEAIRKSGLRDIITGVGRIKNIEEVDRMIASGNYSLFEIARVGEVTHQGIRWRILRSGKHKEWKNRRKNMKISRFVDKVSELITKRDFVNLLKQMAYQLAEREGPAYVKALDNYFSLKNKMHENSIPLSKLVLLFTKYYKGISSGSKYSLEELGEASDITPPYVGQILARVGLPPFYGNLERKCVPKHKKDRMRLAEKLDISSADISYFLDVKPHIAGLNFKHWDLHKHSRKRGLFNAGIHGKLTYRKSSEIYEAQDLGFTRDQTLELLDTNEFLYDFAVRNRNVIEPKIIQVLDFLWPEFKPHDKPYLTHKTDLEGMI